MNEQQLTNAALRFIKAGRQADVLGYLKIQKETQYVPNDVIRELVMLANGLLDTLGSHLGGGDKWLAEMIEETSEPEQVGTLHPYPPCKSCGAVALTDWDGFRGRVRWEHRPGCLQDHRHGGKGNADPTAN